MSKILVITGNGGGSLAPVDSQVFLPEGRGFVAASSFDEAYEILASAGVSPKDAQALIVKYAPSFKSKGKKKNSDVEPEVVTE